jgi:deoxyribodipyrimidine photo-lyase
MGGMSRPIDGQEASSRISPYLTYGCLSLKQVVHMTWARMHDLKAKGDSKFLRSLQAFHARLHWQSHFIQKLESEPRFEYENAFAIYDTIRKEYDDTIMEAIENAKTGIPFIDGIIRQLQATGWINFRARATLVSFVCCTCMQPWQGRFAHWLARLFTDYEPGIHYLQLQMQAGTMGINTVRIYNPVKQLYDKDTDGKFVMKWLPEIARLPKHLQAEPWKISDMESIEYDFILGRDYPFPIVDIEKSNRYARDTLYTLKGIINPDEKKTLLEKHGSRKKTPKKKNIKKQNTQILSDNLSLFD